MGRSDTSDPKLRDKPGRPHAVEAHTDIYKAFLNCGLVIFVGSTVGPEAVALGLKVLRYRPELLLDVDPAEVFGDDIPTGNDGNIREAVLQLARNNQDRTANEAARSVAAKYLPH